MEIGVIDQRERNVPLCVLSQSSFERPSVPPLNRNISAVRILIPLPRLQCSILHLNDVNCPTTIYMLIVHREFQCTRRQSNPQLFLGRDPKIQNYKIKDPKPMMQFDRIPQISFSSPLSKTSPVGNHTPLPQR